MKTERGFRSKYIQYYLSTSLKSKYELSKELNIPIEKIKLSKYQRRTNGNHQEVKNKTKRIPYLENEEFIYKVVNEHKKKLNSREIAAELNVSQTTIDKVLKLKGLKNHPSKEVIARKRKTEKRRKKVDKLTKDGYTIKEIADLLDVTKNTIKNDRVVLKDANR